VILHDLNLASNYGDNFIGLSAARKIHTAPKKEFFCEAVLEDVFNLKFKVVSGEKNFFIQTFG
jgi:ABC-type enterochelin transport system ATPase subunit